MSEKAEPVIVEHKFIVRGNKKSGQKTLSIPEKCSLQTGDEVIVSKVVGGEK